MRFSEKGPAIPDRLLEARDRGEVVFLCGAGVSMPAGLPDFAGLTRSVIDALGAPHDHPARGALGPLEPGASPVPFDQAFDLLERDYGATEVQAVVGELLGKPCPESRHHSVVSRLSTNPEGRPRIVTTNFDRLFHGVPPVALLRSYAPRDIPGLAASSDWSGVVHLHGAVGLGTDELVLSERAFGWAYLSDAYATNFVKALLERHVVVLLGYRAEDPPMRYLLKGLHGAEVTRRRLYAFDPGDRAVAEEAWRDRGVEPIPYGGNHDHLWETLELWAERTDDPRAWRSAVAARVKS